MGDAASCSVMVEGGPGRRSLMVWETGQMSPSTSADQRRRSLCTNARHMPLQSRDCIVTKKRNEQQQHTRCGMATCRLSEHDHRVTHLLPKPLCGGGATEGSCPPIAPCPNDGRMPKAPDGIKLLRGSMESSASLRMPEAAAALTPKAPIPMPLTPGVGET
jgi:hypothetical protein